MFYYWFNVLKLKQIDQLVLNISWWIRLAKQERQETTRFDENLKRLEKLGSLYKDGIISKEEFEEKRKKYKL